MKKEFASPFERDTDNYLGYIVRHSEVLGRQNAEFNKPVTIPELKASIMNHIEVKTQAMIEANQEKYLPISGVLVARTIQNATQEEVRKLRGLLFDLEHELQQRKAQDERMPSDVQKRRLSKIVYVGAILVAIAEGYFAYEALRSARFPLIASLFSAIGIATAIGFGTHILAGYIKKATSRFHRIIRYSTVLTPAFIGFYVLGHLRASSYNTMINLDPTKAGIIHSSQVSEWGITIISFLLFLSALLFSIKFYRSSEERKRDQEYDESKKKLKELKMEEERLRNKIEAVQKAADEQMAQALARYEHALSIEKQLVSGATEALQAYIQANLRHRTDGLCPEFFSYPPPFNFKLFFDTSKRNVYEKDAHYTIS